MGLVDAVLADPTNDFIFLMGTNSSGIWKTRNGGKTWRCVTEKTRLIPGMGVRSFAVNPDNRRQIFAAAGNYVYGNDTYQGKVLQSEDRGDTWTINPFFDSIFEGNALFKVLYSKQGKLYVLGGGSIYRSKDNGRTWELIFKVDEKEQYIKTRAQYLVDLEVSETGVILVSSAHQWGSRGNCWVSRDEGRSWINLEGTPVFNELKKKHILSVKMTSFSKGKIAIGFCDGKEIFLYKSIDYGTSFFKTGTVGLNWETGDAKPSKFELEFSEEHPDRIYMGFIEFFQWDSINGLKMLSPSANISADEHDDVRAMQLIRHDGKEKVLMGNDGGLSLYDPISKKFEGLNGYNLPTLQVYNMAISQFDTNFTIYIGTQDNGTFAYKKGDWNFIGGGDGGGNYLSDDAERRINSINNVLIVNQGKIKRYFSPNKRFTSWYIDFPVEVSAKDSLILFGSARRGDRNNARLYLQGLTQMDQQGVEVPRMQKVGEIAVSNNNPSLIFVAEGEHLDNNSHSSKLMKTLDKGSSFIDLTDALVYPDPYHEVKGRKRDTISLRKILGYRTVTDIEIDPYDDDIIYISLSGYFEAKTWSKSWEYYSVLKSEDGGETWLDYSYGLPVTPIHSLLRDERDEAYLFCGGDEGVFLKKRDRYDWKPYGKDFPTNIAVTDLKINYCQDKIYCATYGRGVFSANLYTISDYSEINKDTEISTYTFIKRDIDVKRGQTLTISADVFMGPNTEITLEPKSKLVVEGGSISSSCTDKWLGVKIQEKRFLWIFKRKKGEVILKEGGTINK